VATTTYDGPGAGTSILRAQAGRTLKVVTGRFSFDSSYPTGGEDISDVFNQFKECLLIWFEQPLTGAQTGKFIKTDYTNKKAQLFTNASPAVEVTNASDQSAIVNLRFIAIGYA
jgi:hypothetical protein